MLCKNDQEIHVDVDLNAQFGGKAQIRLLGDMAREGSISNSRTDGISEFK